MSNLFADLVQTVAPNSNPESVEGRALIERFRKQLLGYHTFPDSNPVKIKATLAGIVAKLQLHGKHTHSLALQGAVDSLPHDEEHTSDISALMLELSRDPLRLILSNVDTSARPRLQVNTDTCASPELSSPSADVVEWNREFYSRSGSSSDVDDGDGEDNPSVIATRTSHTNMQVEGARSVLVALPPPSLVTEPRGIATTTHVPPLSTEGALVDVILDAMLGASLPSSHATAHASPSAPVGPSPTSALDPSHSAVVQALEAAEAACRSIGGYVANELHQACNDWAPSSQTSVAFTGFKAPMLAASGAFSSAHLQLVITAASEAPEAVICTVGRRALESYGPSFVGLRVGALRREAAARLVQTRRSSAHGHSAALGGATPADFVISSPHARMLQSLVGVANDLACALWMCDAVLAAPADVAQRILAASVATTVQLVSPARTTTSTQQAALDCASPAQLNILFLPPLWGGVSRQLAQSIAARIRDIRGAIACIQVCHREHFTAAAATRSDGAFDDLDDIPPRVSLLGLHAWSEACLRPAVELLLQLVKQAFGSAASPLPPPATVAQALAADPLLLLPPSLPGMSAYAAAASRHLSTQVGLLALHAPQAACRAVDAVSQALDRELSLSLQSHSDAPIAPTIARLITPLALFPALGRPAEVLARLFVSVLRPFLSQLDLFVMEPAPRASALLDLPVMRIDDLQVRAVMCG
jgi:hypothetical protein